MNPEHQKARWAEILDGQTVWEKNKVCAGDDDKFQTEYVDPLKALQAEGKFEIPDHHAQRAWAPECSELVCRLRARLTTFEPIQIPLANSLAHC